MFIHKKNFNRIIFAVGILVAVIGFTFGYLYTTGKINGGQAPVEIGSYEGVKVDNGSQLDGFEDVSIQPSVSEDAIFTRKTHYLVCGHTITEDSKVTNDIANLTEMQFKIAYSDWNVEKFGGEGITISRTLNKKCQEHYIVKEKDGKVAVYYQNPVDGVSLKEMTNIHVVNLTKLDQEKLKQGIEINSAQALAELLEDYGS